MKIKYVRNGVQIGFFLLVAFITINRNVLLTPLPVLSNACLHAICPFGGVETFYQLLSTGTTLKSVQLASVVLMVVVFGMALLFGKVFCGWICPLGSVQEWIGKLGSKIFGKQYNHILSPKLDKELRFFPYLVLIWVLYQTAKTGLLIFADYDPYYALFHFATEKIALPALLILLVTLLSSLVVERPWCKYACPYGALLGLFNKVRIFSIHREENSCKTCGLCTSCCPMNIEVSEYADVRSTSCITCLECTSEARCPRDNTVRLSLGKHLRVGYVVLAILVVVLFFGGVFVGDALGYWQVSGQNGNGNGQGNRNNNVENVEQMIDANSEHLNIKGTTTFGDLLAWGLTQEQIETALNAPLPDETMLVKAYCEQNGLSFGAVKQTLRMYLP